MVDKVLRDARVLLDWSRLLLMAAVILAVGVAIGTFGQRAFGANAVDADAIYRAKRLRAIHYHAALAPRGAPVLIGDSIAELSSLDNVCEKDVLNAGVSGATVEQVDDVARTLKVMPGIVIVSVGVNDTVRGRPLDVAEWEASYDRLLNRFPNSRKVVVGISGVEDGKTAGSNYFDPSRIAQLNERLPGIAARHHATFVPGIADTKGLTNDGVHFAPAGFVRWDANIIAATNRASACIG